MILGNVLGAIALGLVIWILTVHKWYWTELGLRNFSGIAIPASRMHRKGCSGLEEYQSLPWGRNRILAQSRVLPEIVAFASRFWHIFQGNSVGKSRVPAGVLLGRTRFWYGNLQGLGLRAGGSEVNFWYGFSRGYSPSTSSFSPPVCLLPAG